MSERVLIVDDDESVRSVLQKVITSSGLEAVTASGGVEALNLLVGEDFSLILLDVNMRGMNGFQVLKRIRARGITTPVIVVSARQDDPDVLYGLSIGADDYITKPFNPVILSAKAKALIRRSRLGGKDDGESPTVISAPPFLYDLSTLTLRKNGKVIDLTAKENAMIKLLMDNPGRIFPVELLYEMVWHEPVVDENAVRVYINRLRSKIEDDSSSPQYLLNVRGLGYKFVPKERR